MLFEKVKPIHLTIAAAVVALGIGLLVWNRVYQASNPILISKVPSDLTLYINGKEVSGDRTELGDGIYDIRGVKSGFADYNGQVVVDDNSKLISVALVAESSEAKAWAEKNTDLYLKQEGETGQYLAESGEKTVSKNPIIARLPISDGVYTVGYKINPEDKSGESIIVTINSSAGNYNAAISSIYKLGYDPANFSVYINNYDNPFSGAKNEQ